MQIEFTPELLADLKEKAEKATRGNWFVTCDNLLKTVVNCVALDRYESRITNLEDDPRSERNADFIAAANPDLILELIAKIEELESENQYLRDWADVDIAASKECTAFIAKLIKILRLDEFTDVSGQIVMKQKDIFDLIIKSIEKENQK